MAGELAHLNEDVKNGRPFLFTDPNELKVKIQNYFDNCDPHLTEKMMVTGQTESGGDLVERRIVLTKQRPYTITGLARALGVNRRTLINYKNPNHYDESIDPKVRQEIIRAIEHAYTRVEEYNEEALHRSGVANGIKFNLSNNFDWVDKKVVDENVNDVSKTLDDLEDEKSELAEKAKEDLEGPHGSGSPAQE